MSEVEQKRPAGLTAIAILWFVGALLNILNSLLVLNQGVAALPYLSNSGLHSWFSFGVPIEMVLSGIVLALGLVQIVTVFGLWTGKKYSYKLALAVPVVHVVLNVCFVALYATAPAELGLISHVWVLSVFGLAVGLAFLVVIWWYLRKPHVKAFLGVAETAKQPPPFTFVASCAGFSGNAQTSCKRNFSKRTSLAKENMDARFGCSQETAGS